MTQTRKNTIIFLVVLSLGLFLLFTLSGLNPSVPPSSTTSTEITTKQFSLSDATNPILTSFTPKTRKFFTKYDHNTILELREKRKRDIKMKQDQCKTSAQASKGGWWCLTLDDAKKQHLLDTVLANYLQNNLFVGKHVGDFGGGWGHYTLFFREHGLVASARAFDGNPMYHGAPGAIVQVEDLSELFPDYETIPMFDWVMTLEVGEHVPPENEDNFIQNVASRAKEGIVLSWAVPGQGGIGHYNNKANLYVQARFLEYGFLFDPVESENLRNLPLKYSWFKNTLMVFRRISDNH